MKPQDALIAFTQDLSVLLSSGADLDGSLQVILDGMQSSPRRHSKSSLRLVKAVQAVRGDIRKGQSLSHSLAAYPEFFDRYFIGMIRSGESSGRLPDVLNRLSEDLEASKLLREQIGTALIYPVLLSGVMLISLIVVLAIVVPRLSALFSTFGSELSSGAQILLVIGNWVTEWGQTALFVTLAAVFLVFLLSQIAEWRRRLIRWLQGLPGIHSLFEQIEFARFTASLGSLLLAGLRQSEALAIAADGMSSSAHRQAMQRVVDRVNEGIALSTAIQAIPSFTAIYSHSIYSGEQSGKLGQTLLVLAQRQQREFTRRTHRLVAVIEPTMVVILGLVIGFVAITVFSTLQSMGAMPVGA